MVDHLCLQNLVSAIISEKFHSHCRLCLKEIDDDIICLQDYLPVNIEKNLYRTLSEILQKLFGNEVIQEVAGIEGICMDCSNQAVQAFKFIESCEHFNKLLHTVIDNVTSALNIDVEKTDEQKLFVLIGSEETKLILVNNENLKKNEPANEKSVICLDCDEVFDDVASLKEHNLIHHYVFTCTKCLDTFVNESDQVNHDASEKLHYCEYCNSCYCTEQSLSKHKTRAHADATFMCKTCGIVIEGLKKLTHHEKTHIERSSCSKCGKSYSTKSSYLKHVKLCLEDKLVKHPIRSNLVRNHICELCGKGYSTSSGLKVHERFVHGNAKPHVCEFCNKKFTAPSYLRAHMLKHTGEKNYACDLCSGKFGTKEALVYHRRRHTGEKPYSCHLCDQQFVNASARAEHIKYKHVGPTLMCDLCPRKFVTPTLLKLHRQKHFDPTHKLYSPRTIMPPNVPGGYNIRVNTDLFENNKHKTVL